MSDITPTRSVIIERKEERRAMHEGYVFLDEKCLLLAGEILRQLARHEQLQREFLSAHSAAIAALREAIGRHGLEELQVYPAPDSRAAMLDLTTRSMMGVHLQDAHWRDIAAPGVPSAIVRSPEAEACARAFGELITRAAPLAAAAGNLERLRLDYRRTMRRARALQDVLLPELDRTLAESESRIEELEQEDALWMRQGAASSGLL
jgi:V/A-type H+/Na+-transporting ATPase subunit D